MNGKEIVINTLEHKKTPRIPWVPFAGVHAGLLCGYNAKEVLTDADKLYESVLQANKLYNADGQPVVFDAQTVADVAVKAENPRDMARKNVEPSRNQHAFRIETVHGFDQFMRAFGITHAVQCLEQCRNRQPPQQPDSHFQGFGEINFSAHRLRCDRRDFVFQVQMRGQIIERFTLHHRRIHIGQQQALAAVFVEGLNKNIKWPHIL